jgi:hypothetical protein
VGNNLKEGPIGQQEQDQRHKFRDHERKAWNIRKDERRFVLRHRAGPGRQGTCLGLPMVTGVTVSPGMEMETSGGRLLEINEARVADKPRDQSDHDNRQATATAVRGARLDRRCCERDPCCIVIAASTRSKGLLPYANTHSLVQQQVLTNATACYAMKNGRAMTGILQEDGMNVADPPPPPSRA